MMLLIPPLLIILLSGPAHAFIKPGEITQSNLPRLRSEATVVATAIAEDGSVFLMGDFDEVDGIPRPGLAKLTSSGHLDSSFEPQLGVEMRIQVRSDLPNTTSLIPNHPVPLQSAFDNGNTIRFDDKPRPYLYPETELFALNEGRLFVRNETAWTILDANGVIDDLAFPGFDRTSASALPQLLQDNRLIVLTDDDRLVALDLANGDLTDPTFELDPLWTGTIQQAVSAGSGKLWLLSRRDRFMVVCRLNSDGTMDTTFPPLELRDGGHYRIASGSNGGFILTNKSTGFIIANPIDIFAPTPVIACCIGFPWRNEQRVQWFNAIGVLTGVVQADIGIGGRTLLHSAPWNRAIFFNNNTQRWESQYTNGILGNFPDFPYANPNQSSDLPLVLETIDLMPGSSNIFSPNYLIGGTRLLTANGSLHPDRHIARLTRQAITLKARRLPDDALLVSGDFSQADQYSCRGMVKILPDGTIDESFSPDLDLRFIREFEVKPDGGIFVLLSRPWSDPDGKQFNLLALSADGRINHEFTQAHEPLGGAQIELLADGSLLVENSFPARTHFGGQPLLVAFWGNTLQRILPSGEIDSDWPLAIIQPPIHYGSHRLLSLEDGSFLWGNRHYDSEGILIDIIVGETNLSPLAQNEDGSVIFQSRASSFPSLTQIHRWTGGPELDPTFISGLSPQGTAVHGVQFGSRGKLLLWGHLNTPSGPRSLVRLHGTGQVDYTFDPLPLQHHLLPTTTPSILTNTGLAQFSHSRFSSKSVPSFLFKQNDSFLAGGSFGESEGNFVHLADSHLSGYSDWITSATGEYQDTSHDFDQDGRSNLHEYALGTDPGRPDALTDEIQRASLSPLRFQLACNPEAPEVRRTIEVSTNLTHWEIGTGQHFTTEPGPGCLNLRMTQSEHRLFLRTRYSLP